MSMGTPSRSISKSVVARLKVVSASMRTTLPVTYSVVGASAGDEDEAEGGGKVEAGHRSPPGGWGEPSG